MSERPGPTFRSQVLFFGFIQVVLKLRAFVTVPILSRVIGTEGYGTLSALLAFNGMAQMLLLFGIPTSLTVFIPWLDTRERKSREFWMVAQVLIAASAVLIAVAALMHGQLIAAFFRRGFDSLYFFLALALIPLNVMNAVLYSQIINNRQARPYAGIATAATAAELAALLASVWFLGLKGVLLSSVFGQALTVCLMAALVLRETPFVPLRAPFVDELKKYYTYSFAIFITSLAGWIIDSSDRLIIGKFRSIAELGVYQVSYGLCTHTAELAAPLFATLMPFVATAVAESRHDSAREYLEKAFRMLLMLFVPVAVFFSLEARDMLAVLSVKEFYSGASIVPWVVSGIALHQLLGVYTFNLHAHKKGYMIIISVGAAALLNIVLNLIFVPKYGINAAAVSTASAYALHFVIVRTISGKYLGIGVSAAHVLKVFASAGVLGVVVCVTGMLIDIPAVRLVVSLAAGGCCYVGALLLLKAVGDDDRDRAFAFIKAKVSIVTGRGAV